ncbi:MAG: hypothetical protein HYU36_22535 [Planctomycetes bacterium]|nr:hypothetical protein [Planctomycetota bacterium]
MRLLPYCFLWAILLGGANDAAKPAWAEPEAVHVPLLLNRPKGLETKAWPITVGIPFRRGLVHDLSGLTVMNKAGQGVACQLTATSPWEDGSVRWALVDFMADLSESYSVRPGRSPSPEGPVQVESSPQGIMVRCGGAEYRFQRGRGCFDSLRLGDQVLIDEAGGAFYVVDSLGRRGILQSDGLRVELAGPLHSVIRVQGEYRTPEGERDAAGVVYYHFYSGLPWVRISHKLIVTEETLDLWFRDIGVALPLNLKGKLAAAFNTQHQDVTAHTAILLGRSEAAVMVQADYPHFASTASEFRLSVESGRASRLVAAGRAAGDWADISSESVGLAVQLAGFAEQFPKAFRLSSRSLAVKFWASECGRELDFRTPQIIRSYFGHDWIPEGHALVKTSNTARGSARTHDLWLMPRRGGFRREALESLGGTASEIYATPDPAWTSASGVMDAFLAKDPAKFPAAEAAIEDYYLRNVAVPERIFPNTGYLCWGRNPYTSAGWHLRDGRWYPPLHRLGRGLEYNLRRGVWVLYARSGERLYREYARRYTRFLGDFGISNWETPLKPRGWLIQGLVWDSPCFWGAFEEADIRKGERAPTISNVSCLGYGTSEDVIQFVYDYFMAGDFHSRDAAMAYKEALVKEMNFDVQKALDVIPSYVILRPMGSAYEIDRDPKLYAYGHQFLERIVADSPDGLNPQQAQNFVKSGEIWAGFYHYYVSTGDELALKPLLRGAHHYYRTNQTGLIYRGSGMLQAFAIALEKTKEPGFLAWLRQAVEGFDDKSLREAGIDPHEVGQDFDRPWGHDGAITAASPVTIGIPVSLRVMEQHAKHLTPRVPLAAKSYPAQKTFLYFQKDKEGVALMDLYVNNFGETRVQPRVFRLSGEAVPFEMVEQEEHRVGKPHGDANWQHEFNHFYGTYESHCFFRMKLGLPPGTYRIDAGEEVAHSVLYSDVEKFLQAAPDGMVIAERTFFPVPAGSGDIEFFSHFPMRVSDPIGQETPVEPVGKAVYRFSTRGQGGVWRLEPSKAAFVRFLNFPMVVATGDRARIFPLELSAGVPGKAEEAVPPPAGDFAAGRFGQGVFLPPGRFVDFPLDGEAALLEQGTVECWLQPFWSSTDVFPDPGYAKLVLQLLRLDPILLQLVVDHQFGEYRYFSRLNLLLPGLQPYPVHFFSRAGKWYHLAVCWKADGRDSDVEVYVNGRRRSYYDYHGGIPRALAASQLGPPGRNLRFGTAVTLAKVSLRGQVFDEVRISRSVRYRDDFQPREQAFVSDGDTVLLLHLDGALEGMQGDKPVRGTILAGKGLKE